MYLTEIAFPLHIVEVIMNYQIKRWSNAAVLSVSGEIDRFNDMKPIVEQAHMLASNKHSIFAMDMSDTSYITASICGFLVSIYKNAKENHAKFALIVPLNHRVMKVLKIAGINKVINIYSSRDSFLKYYENGYPVAA